MVEGSPASNVDVGFLSASVFRVCLDRLSPQVRDVVMATQVAVEDRADLVLLDRGFVGEQELASVYGEVLDLAVAAAADLPADAILTEAISPAFLRQSLVLPLSSDGVNVRLAMADPLDRQVIENVELATGLRVERSVAAPGLIIEALSRLYNPRGTAEPVATIASTKDEPETEATRLLDQLTRDALAAQASDIHLEAREAGLRIRFRVDGDLRDAGEVGERIAPELLGRLKVLSGLDVAEKRLPQDGRRRQMINGRALDMRVSLIPGLYGESAVVRLLDRAAGPVGLDQLGFGDDLVQGLRDLVAQPHGLVLVCGPTGSGKTTTLYALLRELNVSSRKILTVEDPVEYELENITQVQVRAQIGLGFPQVLRSFLRHDPNVLMVGEIRDAETAKVAVQAALTGHLVLSTVHTNDAVGAVGRLLDMGVEPYLLASVLSGVVSQRLARKLCASCAGEETAPQHLQSEFGMTAIGTAIGCAECGQSGYRGRVAVGELLQVDEPLATLISAKADHSTLAEQARSAGMTSMMENVRGLLRDGTTSIDEIFRLMGSAP